MERSFLEQAKSVLLGPRGRSIGLCLLVTVLMAILSFLPLGRSLENQTLDLFYRLRPMAPQPADLLIVAIDEPSFQELPYPWPWPRRLHADLVRRLVAGGARLIVFDVIFAGTTKPEDDKLLADAFREAGNVVLGLTFEVARDPRFSRRILISPLKSLESAAKEQGLSIITPDPDGVVRRFRLSLGEQETLPLAAFRLIRPRATLPSPLHGLIDYAGPARSIDTVSYYQVIDPERPLPSSRIRGRIVLVGQGLEASATPQAQADAFYTPFYAKDGQRMSGVEIQANILNTLMEGSWGRELPRWLHLALLVALILMASLVLTRLRPMGGLIFTAASLMVLAALSFGLFFFMRWWIPPFLISTGLVLVYAGNVLGHYFMEAREKRWLRQAFGRYVAPSVVEAITLSPDRLELGGEELETTVLFADLEGFTRLSETMPPQALIQLLNDYFTPMTQIIMAYRGTLDKYIGDALMALWGAPVPQSDHALRACWAAIEMEKTMAELQVKWQSQGLPPLAERLGLHTGPVVAGNVGSRDRFNYTVLGDTVALASLLEEVNKVYGTRILLSGETCQRVKDHLLVRELDTVRVRGRAQTMTVYELVGPYPPEGFPPWLDAFAAGLKAYRGRQWDRAAQAFQEVLQLKPGDRPAGVFLKRCGSLARTPPPSEWQAVFVLESS
jgi:adenylate cyclase